jgi:acyl-CoA thioesterase FadM
MGSMAKKKKRTRHSPRLKSPVSTYADAEGNVLTLRQVISQGSVAKVREEMVSQAANVDDIWQRRTEILFERPVKVGHTINIYGEAMAMGTTSIALRIEARRYNVYTEEEVVVCTTQVVFVRIDEDGNDTWRCSGVFQFETPADDGIEERLRLAGARARGDERRVTLVDGPDGLFLMGPHVRVGHD